MLTKVISVTVALTCIIGCGSISNTNRTNIATKIVLKSDQARIEHVSIAELHESFLNRIEPSTYTEEVVEITGTVVAFALTENNLYTVTVREDELDAICVFDKSISNQLGEGKPIHSGAILSIHGQCYGSGLFSTTPFTLNGCRIVSK